jgi:dTMP kinase
LKRLLSAVESSLFITFEGIEGCGKTTQVDRLVKVLEARNITVVRTFEPGGTDAGGRIRHILLDRSSHDLVPMAELFLYEADRAQHVAQVIRPALDRGAWVICDRFFDATVVYQGVARGQDSDLVARLNQAATGGIRPARTFVLDCPVEMGLERAIRRNQSLPDAEQDRFEREKLHFHQTVRQGYLDLAQKEPERFVVVDAARHADEVERDIFDHIEPLLPA